METRTRFTVDSDHCRRAADELYEVLRGRERAFIARWDATRALAGAAKLARVIGLGAALLGLLFVGALLYFDTRSWSTQPSVWLIPFFVGAVPVFVFQPRITARLQEWLARSADKRARRNADRGLRKARQLAPYQADYEIKGDLLVYTRTKDDVSSEVWSRALGRFRARGIAVQSESLTAIFRRPTSLIPSVLILQRGRDWTDQVLREVGMKVVTPPERG